MERCNGFTLLEVMVALVIFSMISIGAFGVLASLLRGQEALEAQGEQLDNLQRLLLMAQHDISQIAPRSPISGTGFVTADTPGSLAFTRLGWRNPMNDTRSTLAYVRYDFSGGILTRQVYPFAEADSPTQAITQTLASGLVLGQIASQNTSAAAPPPLPAVISIAVTMPPFGEVKQVIPLVQAQ